LDKSYAGKYFAVILTGAATLIGAAQQEGWNFQHLLKESTCPGGWNGPDYCQYLTGHLPTAMQAGFSSDLPTDACVDRFKPNINSTEVVSLTISGNAPYNRVANDLFHSSQTFPIVIQDDANRKEGNFDGIPIAEPISGIADAKECIVSQVSNNVEMASTTEDPSTVKGGYAEWDGDSVMDGFTTVYRRRDAEQWGNISVASAGAAFALGIGFIPLAYEAAGTWRRQHRRAKHRASNGS
jgi:hypothetical protein